MTAYQIIAIAAVVVAIVALAAACATQSGRDALALLGLDIAKMLTRWLEQRLSSTARRLRK
jgi:hypothetical protein